MSDGELPGSSRGVRHCAWGGPARIAIVAVALASCGRGTPAPQPVQLDAAAESYVRLVLALAERDPDSLDNYRGPADWQTDARRQHATLASIDHDATALADVLAARSSEAGDDPIRRDFLVRQLRAVGARAKIVAGARPRFADEARALFGIDTPPPFTAPPAVRAELDRLIPGHGDLPSRYAAFDRRFLIAPDRLPTVLTRAIDACRAATLAHVALPDGEHIEVAYVPGLPWSAFTRYEGRFRSVIRVNAALPLTVDRALDLACHEAYPGHHTINSLIEKRLGSTRIELLVQPLFSPQSLLHEAASSNAPALAFSDAERLVFERDALFPLAGLDPALAERYVRVGRLIDRLHPVEADIARRYLDDELDFPRASEALRREALMPSADATLKFLNQFRTYAATYTTGRDLLSAEIDRRVRGATDEPSARWDAYTRIATDPAQRVPMEVKR
ncbi:MAG TPA: hypothetical protein VGJ29_13925 [Vicinamibacterales bacterium]